MVPKRILLVDDDPTFGKYLVTAFADRGYVAFGAHDYESAMNVVADTAPEFAVVDLKLGAESGLTLLRDMLRACPTMRIVVLTGYGSIATAVRAVRLGARDYLSKPANADDLIAALEQAGAESEPTEHTVGSSPTLADAQWEHIQRILADCAGNITHAAERLGVHRRSLQRKLSRGRG